MVKRFKSNFKAKQICLVGSTRVHSGPQVSTGVYKGPQGFHRGPQGSTGVHRGPQGSTRVHKGLQYMGLQGFLPRKQQPKTGTSREHWLPEE